MREPDLKIDGWCIVDCEAENADSSEPLWLPDRTDRMSLEPGDLVRLFFCFSCDDRLEPVAREQVIVLVRQRIPGGYYGELCNHSFAEPTNYDFYEGMELPFAARHIFQIKAKGVNTVMSLQYPVRISWRAQSWENMRIQREMARNTSDTPFRGTLEI